MFMFRVTKLVIPNCYVGIKDNVMYKHFHQKGVSSCVIMSDKCSLE